jgi:hypothetical protein
MIAGRCCFSRKQLIPGLLPKKAGAILPENAISLLGHLFSLEVAPLASCRESTIQTPLPQPYATDNRSVTTLRYEDRLRAVRADWRLTCSGVYVRPIEMGLAPR